MKERTRSRSPMGRRRSPGAVAAVRHGREPPLLVVLRHAVLIGGVLMVAFPLYVTFVASTLSLDEVIQVPMPLLPGTHFLENYSAVLTHGSQRASGAAVGPMMWNSLVMALVIAIGKISISHHLGVRDRLFPLPVAQDLLLDDLRHADAAGGGAHLPDLSRSRRTWASQHLRRPDAAADRVGDGHVPVPPVLHDHTATSSPRPRASTAPGRCASCATSSCRCPGPTSPRCSSSCSSTAGTSTCGRCW